MKEFNEACKEIAKKAEKKDVTKEELEDLKREVCSSKKLSRYPKNSEIIEHIENEHLKKKYKIKPTRSISGVNVVAVMTSPKECPHGSCTPCPGGPEYNSPQSYTGKEPAARRAIRRDFDPYDQVTDRINQFKRMGHTDTNKIELIVMGGTVPARDFEYNKWFLKRCFDAMNKKQSESLEEAKQRNEDAENRCVGITFETRPDYCGKEELNQLLKLGGTRVELGVQTLDNRIYENINRGHSIEEVTRATSLSRNSGLKIAYHMMPGLPGSDMDKDIKMIKDLFNDSRFYPDAIKIYPTVVVEGTELFEMYKKGDYEPLTNEETINLLVEIKKELPPYVRVKRIMRDIPAHEVKAGPDMTNIREVVWHRLEDTNERCRCVRCREAGHLALKEEDEPIIENVELVRRDYKASGGKEIFLSFEDTKKDIIIGLLRLRELNNPFREELQSGSGMVRELHVYGEVAPLGEVGKWQHKEYGEKLLEKAESITLKEFDKDVISVISAVGTRNYYRKFGYAKNGVYMSKELK